MENTAIELHGLTSMISTTNTRYTVSFLMKKECNPAYEIPATDQNGKDEDLEEEDQDEDAELTD